MKIDFVVPWVDGADVEWQKSKLLHTGVATDISDVRYRDWGGFKYWFRSVENYAPWVNRIFLITAGQVPSWLNTNHPKLCLIDHKDYIPDECLPTFSSHAIELNLHRVIDLSENFVYFNDDMFLNDFVNEDDFFCQGKPRLSAVLNEFTPTVINDTFQHFLCNDIAFINTYFNKKEVIKHNFRKWFTVKYGRYVLKNIFYALGCDRFSMIQNFHMPSPMLKSTYKKVWTLEYDLLYKTSLHKLRDNSDVNQYIMSYYDICSGNFAPKNPSTGKYYEIGKRSDVIVSDILNGYHKMICINDAMCDNYTDEIQKIMSAFDKKFPDKSTYEL